MNTFSNTDPMAKCMDCGGRGYEHFRMWGLEFEQGIEIILCDDCLKELKETIKEKTKSEAKPQD